MWLINTETIELKHFLDASKAPEYAILSHCWGADEMTFQDFQENRKCTGPGYRKVEDCCNLARCFPWWHHHENHLTQGFEWVWIDTVCIDKSSSAELSEAINSSKQLTSALPASTSRPSLILSVWSWYKSASVCFAFLEDVDATLADARTTLQLQLSQSRWFTRGWTLQELIAPGAVLFVDVAWHVFGQKSKQFLSRYKTVPSFTEELEVITGIPKDVLLHAETLFRLSTAQRLSWGSRRTTSRTEDVAYSLLGLFDINMPLLYGEGKKAFGRLQREILLRRWDESILAWSLPQGTNAPTWSGQMLATSPKDFARAGQIVEQNRSKDPALSMRGEDWQLMIQNASSMVFRHPTSPLIFAVRLRCAQHREDVEAVVPCVLIIYEALCGHFERVVVPGVENFTNNEPEGWADLSKVNGTAVDESSLANPSNWQAIKGPLTMYIHDNPSHVTRCASVEYSTKSLSSNTYVCLGEKEPKVVKSRKYIENSQQEQQIRSRKQTGRSFPRRFSISGGFERNLLG